MTEQSIEETVKSTIKEAINQSDDNPELEFLTIFGSIREEVVYKKKLISIDQFDTLCKEILDELEMND